MTRNAVWILIGILVAFAAMCMAYGVYVIAGLPRM